MGILPQLGSFLVGETRDVCEGFVEIVTKYDFMRR